MTDGAVTLSALSRRIGIPRLYAAAALVAVLAFAGGGALLASTLPYHQWDSFGFAAWSREIAQHGTVDPMASGIQQSARPLFYELQGLLWWIFGIGFTAGRVLSLAFALLFVLAAFLATRALTRSTLDASLATAAAVAIVPFAAQSLSGQTDVPSAGTIALAVALVLRAPRSPAAQAGIALAAAAAILTKQTAWFVLLPLALVLLVEGRRDLRGRLRSPLGALLAGLAIGLAYEEWMAGRFGTGLVTYLRVGTTGIWAQFAAQTRGDALLRMNLLGTALRLPLTFGLLYALLRLPGVRHRLAVPLALAGALAWSIAGPIAAGVPHGAFAHPEDSFTLVGFALVLAAGAGVDDRHAPTRRTLLVLLALALPPLAAWADAGTYADRLASAAWPGVAMLTGCVVATGVRGARRLGPTAALAPLAIVAMAVWMSLAGLDGLHGSMWTEYRSLGWSGLGDRQRTMHVVLPTIEDSLALAETRLGNGRLIAGDPTFAWFLPPGRVASTTPEHCRDVAGFRIFVLSTSNEAEQEARDAGGLATPADWAACRSPRLTQLSDGGNGYAVFAVS